MQDDTLNVEADEREAYPWARSLLVIVLYVSLLIVLWHFPISGARAFFRNLLRGFGYLLSGLVLVGLTFIALTFIPLPFNVEHDDTMDDEDDDGEWVPATLSGRVLMIPDLKKPSSEMYVMDTVYDFAIEYDIPSSMLVMDTVNGALTIALDEEDEDEAGWVLDSIKRYLREAEIRVHNPR